MSLRPAALVATLSLAPTVLSAQPGPSAAAADPIPPTIEACYVPASGTIYRVDTPTSPAPGAPKQCLSATHVRFTWNQQGPAGPPGPKGDKGDPGSAASIGPDLSLPGALTMGKTGTFGGGLLATEANPLATPSGAGVRFMWVPQSAALRAGRAIGTTWDASSIGLGSAAFGTATRASGNDAVAIGDATTASGNQSFAVGVQSTASHTASFAGGSGSVASGLGAFAFGGSATASGEWSVALGRLASTAGRIGSFVFGDASSGSAVVTATGENQFVVRAAGGVRLRTSSDLAKGCNIDGQGNLSCTGTVAGAGGLGIGPDLALAGKLSVAQTGAFGGGFIASDAAPLPVPSGGGTRFMWVPQKAALRAGAVAGSQWDDASVGLYSVALGRNTTASGGTSVALGAEASTNGKAGAFVFGDGTGGDGANVVRAAVDNEFLVRASGGVRLRTSSDLSKGCNVDGQGNLTCTGAVSLSGSVSRPSSGWVDVPGASSRTATVVCPVGTVVVGGGVDTARGDGGDFKVRETYPNTSLNAWIGTIRNDDLAGGFFRVHAICLRA
jgi:hypothetical protein